MITFFLIPLTVASYCLAIDANLMDPFDPSRITGKWFVTKRNAQLLEKSVHCVSIDLTREPNGKDFTMMGSWTDNKKVLHENKFTIADDQTHPAKFFFKSDAERVALSILGSDYINWAVAFGIVSMNESYFVAFRKLPDNGAFSSEIQKVLDANNVDRDFITIDHSEC